MTPLGDKLARLIGASGPMTIQSFMSHCLFDPEHGYYTTSEPFGRQGDFTTAPEISQMFGELIGIWLGAAWQAAGSPKEVVIAEIGPGRGTMMKDMLRTLAKTLPALAAHARFVLIEVSPRLREVQAATLADAPLRPEWIDDIGDLPDLPLLIVGNELFDAVPLRQFVKTAEGWRERMVTVAEDGLAFRAGQSGLDPAFAPPKAELGAILEIAPARSALMQRIAEHIARNGGAGLFIDYGYAKPAVGDTLQALRHHEYADPLAEPGLADVTAHVDFHALAQTARQCGLGSGLREQGDFLIEMGLLERAGRLGAGRGPELQERLAGEAERLAGAEQMGILFKCLGVTPGGTMLPGFGMVD